VNRIRQDSAVRTPADFSALPLFIDADRSMTASSFGLKVFGCMLGLAAFSGGGIAAHAHHVPGDDHTGVTLTMDPPSSSGSSTSGVRAMYPTRSEAEAAAPLFGCKGAHQMGDQWMPCAAHSHGDHGKH
jgi:hypothetical protein